MYSTILLILLATGGDTSATLELTPTGPISTFEAARDEVRNRRRAGARGPVTVVVREGVYHLSTTLELTAEDSDVTFVAAPNEHPSICGGIEIGAWSQSSDGVWRAAVPPGHQPHQLFVDSARAARARTPNFGYLRVNGSAPTTAPFTFSFRGEDIPSRYAGAGAEVVALIAWSDLRMAIAAVDPKAHRVAFNANAQAANKEADARYYLENVREALDAPGEWFLDRASSALLYIPRTGQEMKQAQAVASSLNGLLRVRGDPSTGRRVRNVTFRGIRFCHTDWTMPDGGFSSSQATVYRTGGGGKRIEPNAAIDVEFAEGIVFDGCAFTQLGDFGVRFGKGSRTCRVENSTFFDLGAGALLVGETESPTTPDARTSDIAVTDNHIHETGKVFPSAAAIWIGQCIAATVAHNHIHDTTYSAVSLGWTWDYGPPNSYSHRIEFNYIHNVGRSVLSDLGAIYTLGVQPGTVIRGNVIHDVDAFSYGAWGIYADAASSKLLIEDNIVYRCRSAGFHQHFGRENIVRNNVFAFNGDYQVMRTRPQRPFSFQFERNIVVFDRGPAIRPSASAADIRSNKNVFWDTSGDNPDVAGCSLVEWRRTGHDVDSVRADPGLSNLPTLDLTGLNASAMSAIGFAPIDVRGVGPRPRERQ